MVNRHQYMLRCARLAAYRSRWGHLLQTQLLSGREETDRFANALLPYVRSFRGMNPDDEVTPVGGRKGAKEFPRFGIRPQRSGIDELEMAGTHARGRRRDPIGRLILAQRHRRIDAGGAGGRNRGGHHAGRDDDEQTHRVGDRIEDVNDRANGGGGRCRQEQRGQAGG
jgi:hypothetical protein